jgi:hypothetical protein
MTGRRAERLGDDARLNGCLWGGLLRCLHADGESQATVTFGWQRRARCAASSDKGKYQRDLQGQGNTPVKRRGRGVVWDHRISAFLPAGMKNSGERFARPGGVSDGGKRGKLERRPGDIYSGRWSVDLAGE